MLVALVASLFAPPLVSYETLAKPLPEILADIAPMVGKRIDCDNVLAQDRLCIYVQDVEPRELLNKVVEAVAGTMREEGGTITVLQDHGFEQKLVERRNAA